MLSVKIIPMKNTISKDNQNAKPLQLMITRCKILSAKIFKYKVLSAKMSKVENVISKDNQDAKH